MHTPVGPTISEQLLLEIEKTTAEILQSVDEMRETLGESATRLANLQQHVQRLRAENQELIEEKNQ